jgi:hypothetical protein
MAARPSARVGPRRRGGRTVAEWRFQSRYTASEFALSCNGRGGTDIALTGAAMAGFLAFGRA